MSATQNVEYLEAAQEDFDEFLAKKDWGNAHAIIDNLWDQGFDHEAEILRRAYLRAQARTVFAPKQCTYNTRDCSYEDECGCNQFSADFTISYRKGNLFDLSRAVATMIGKEPKEMVWHKGKILITSLPSKAMTF